MYRPLFCPNYLCSYHQKAPSEFSWFYRIGFYHTKAFGKVRRFKCLGCGKSFSTQTFLLNYYVKRPVDYRPILEHLCSSSGIRATSRWLAVSHQTITNRIGRLARQAMAIQAELTDGLRLSEDLVTDGFESFVADQYQPNNIHLLTGSLSQFLYSFDYAHLRRKGRMTKRQKAERHRREQDYIRERISISKSFRRIIGEVEHLLQNRSTVHTFLSSDKKQEYRLLIKHSLVLQYYRQAGTFTHRCVSSKRPRTFVNPLFPVNYLDRELRKDNANQVRETVQFSRSVNNCLERLAVYQLYHNFMKPFRIDHCQKRKLLHGQVAGIRRERIEDAIEKVFEVRKFYSHVQLSFSQLLVWARMVGSLHRRDGGYRPQYVWM